MTHTPTPWQIIQTPEQIREMGIDASNWFEIGDDEGTVCSTRGRSEKINGANAAFIVRACNTHGVLVNELERQRTLAVRRFNSALEKDSSSAVLNKLQSETDRIDRALKLARGEV